MNRQARIVAVSLGCPAGVGPEIVVLAAKRSKTRLVVVGDRGVIERALRGVGSKAKIVEVSSREEILAAPKGALALFSESHRLSSPPPFGRPRAIDGRAQLAWIDQALDLIERGVVDAMATAPVSKEVVVRGGARAFRGHTEHLAARTGAREVVMAFYERKLSVSLVTTHLPLSAVPRAITPARVATSAYWLARMLLVLAKKRPRVAICGLNPHAGEAGLLGTEEKSAIAPGIRLARSRLAREDRDVVLYGPLGAETALRVGASGGFEGVVAMYHDQATIPMKLLSFGDAVNVTLGLPIVRTSVDHGTAYDIAGKGTADAQPMLLAIDLAARLAGANVVSISESASRSRSSPARRSRR